MKTPIKLVIAAVIGIAAGTQTAYANDPYIGIGGGVFNLGDGVSKKKVGGGFLQVGDDFSEYLGAEIRIGATGRTGEELTLQARKKIDYYLAAYLKPRYQFNDQWTAYALLGIATLRGSYVAAKAGAPTLKKTRTGYAYGLGVSWRMAEHYGISAEFSHMLSKPKTANPATNFKGLEASSLAISLQYYLY